MQFFDLLFWLIAMHFLCDFALQNDYLAINKNPILEGKPNPVWGWCMTAHCFIHAIPVMWLTGRLELALFILVTHFAIDYFKCLGKFSYSTDQKLHIAVLVWTAVFAVVY